MKFLTGILLIHNLFVHGNQSTVVPSAYTTQTSIPDLTSSVSSTTTSTSTLADSDPLNRDFNAQWYYRRTTPKFYRRWRTTPAPVPIPVYTQSRPIHNFQCGQIGIFQRYQVSNHDNRGKCENCYEIGLKRANLRHAHRELARVVNGHKTKEGEVPWNVEIYHYNNKFKTCGATLISANKVLSAAHCFDAELRNRRNRYQDYIEAAIRDNNGNVFRYNYKVAAGIMYPELTDDKNSKTIQIRDVTKIAIPRKYKGHLDRQLMNQHKNHVPNKKFDIAVMILRTPFIINDYVIPACLPPSRIQLQNGLGVVSGLGLTNLQSSELSQYLKRGLIEIVPGPKCKKNFEESGKIFNGAHMLCGVGKKRHRSRVDSCQGDSGGPLVVKVNNRYTVVGVVSWGDLQCKGTGAYSKVSKYLKFINRIN